MNAPGGTVGRGAVAGILAATVLAVWFLLVDGLAGEPFATPAFLASALLGGDAAVGDAISVALYTVIHYGAFVVVGIASAWVVGKFAILPVALLGIVLGFLLTDLLFYGSVWMTGIDIVRGLGWPAVLAGNVLAGVTLLASLAAMGQVRTVDWREVLAEHRIVREGLAAGLIGATAVAAWFLLIDVVQGRLFFTPAALGSALFHGARDAAAVNVTAFTVLGYTAVHLSAFVMVGLVAAAVATHAEEFSEALILVGVMLFAAFQAFSIGVLAIVAGWLAEALSWTSIAAANLIALVSMGYYLYTRHRVLLRDFRDRDLEGDVARDVVAPGAPRGGHAAPEIPAASPGTTSGPLSPEG